MSLIKCSECGNQISDKASFCPHCGYSAAAPPQKRIQTRFHRLPNGFGQIKKLTGKRRKPFMVLPPTQGYDNKGDAIIGKPLGYFETYKEAFDCLNEWHRNPFENSKRNMDFSQVYKAFFAEKFESGQSYASSTLYAYKAAYKHCEDIYGRKYTSLRQDDFMSILKHTELKHSSLELILNLFKQMDKYALQHDIIDKAYSQFAYIPIPDDDEHGEPFSVKELETLWKNVKQPNVKIVLTMCYTGFRISAYKSIVYKDNAFIGGIKTQASKDRTVPLHPDIKKFAPQIVGMSAAAIRKVFTEVCDTYHMDHTPHDARHTFSWLLSSSGCDEITRRMLMGHTLGSDVDSLVYTHRTIDELRKAVEKIPCYLSVAQSKT